jgi:V8-like Glu-specific endopeptidase
MAYLNGVEQTEVVNAAIAAGLGSPAARTALKAAMNQDFVAGSIIDNGGSALLQLYADLNVLNPIDQLADGSVPLRDWLRRAGELARASQRREADVFTKYEARVAAQASGQKAIPDPTQLREVVNNEDIVHRDDMVDFWFLEAGAFAGKSVVKVFVPRYENGVSVMENGKPRRTVGTGWLLTEQLVMTNHHVVHFRKQGEAPATNADLLLQGKNAIVKFDYNSADDDGEDVEVEKLEAWDENLDFAILRLKNAVTRTPLKLDNSRVVFSDGIYVPLNIIQHPSGHPKRVALRNNLLTAADATTIRYFTDTLNGSSGSPVFDDRWRVIGLHRGSTAVNGVSFQGRTTAVVNVGTQIAAILDHLDVNANALRQEIPI